MTPRIALFLLAILAAPAAHADLTLHGYSTAGPLSTQERIWIREGQLRRDYVERGRAFSQIFDFSQKRLALIDHATRQIEWHDLESLHADTGSGAPSATVQFTLTPTGASRPLRHWHCEAHRLTASMPARLGNEDAVFHLDGTVWIARNPPEQVAVRQWLALSKKPDFFLGVPAAVKATPAQARMLSELARALASRGLPCGGELDARHEGSGPLALLAKRIPARLTLELHDFSDAPIAADMFAVPAGYRARR